MAQLIMFYNEALANMLEGNYEDTDRKLVIRSAKKLAHAKRQKNKDGEKI